MCAELASVPAPLLVGGRRPQLLPVPPPAAPGEVRVGATRPRGAEGARSQREAPRPPPRGHGDPVTAGYGARGTGSEQAADGVGAPGSGSRRRPGEEGPRGGWEPGAAAGWGAGRLRAERMGMGGWGRLGAGGLEGWDPARTHLQAGAGLTFPAALRTALGSLRGG